MKRLCFVVFALVFLSSCDTSSQEDACLSGTWRGEVTIEQQAFQNTFFIESSTGWGEIKRLSNAARTSFTIETIDYEHPNVTFRLRYDDTGRREMLYGRIEERSTALGDKTVLVFPVSATDPNRYNGPFWSGAELSQIEASC